MLLLSGLARTLNAGFFLCAVMTNGTMHHRDIDTPTALSVSDQQKIESPSSAATERDSMKIGARSVVIFSAFSRHSILIGTFQKDLANAARRPILDSFCFRL
jgi:hypothetical protein